MTIIIDIAQPVVIEIVKTQCLHFTTLHIISIVIIRKFFLDAVVFDESKMMKFIRLCMVSRRMQKPYMYPGLLSVMLAPVEVRNMMQRL